MTCRERLKIEHPELVAEEYEGGCCDCPSDYSYMEDPPYCGDSLGCCSRCWDRELPYTKTITTEPKEDVVNHPSHYTTGGMECIDEMVLVFGKETVADFCLCNVWKYRKRALLKNGQEDMDKADWYMNKYAELQSDMFQDIVERRVEAIKCKEVKGVNPHD